MESSIEKIINRVLTTKDKYAFVYKIGLIMIKDYLTYIDKSLKEKFKEHTFQEQFKHLNISINN